MENNTEELLKISISILSELKNKRFKATSYSLISHLDKEINQIQTLIKQYENQINSNSVSDNDVSDFNTMESEL